MFNHEPKDYKCPLCIVGQGKETEINKRSDVIFEDEEIIAYISPKWWVNNPGNVMVIPREHVENVYDISDVLLSKVQVVGKKIALAMKKAYGCEGVSFRQHNEQAGNQDVWHYHLHVFPRWENDDLYINHENKRFTTPEERVPYAQKLRGYFQD